MWRRPRELGLIVRRRNPSRAINECRHQRIFGALVNLPVEDKALSAFDSFVIGEATRKRPTSPGKGERAWCCQSLTALPGLERVGRLFSSHKYTVLGILGYGLDGRDAE